MNRKDAVYRLYLHDDAILYQPVKTKTYVESDPIEGHRNGMLDYNVKAVLTQNVCQARAVHVLQ